MLVYPAPGCVAGLQWSGGQLGGEEPALGAEHGGGGVGEEVPGGRQGGHLQALLLLLVSTCPLSATVTG